MNKQEEVKKDDLKDIHEKRKNIPEDVYQKIAKKVFKNIIKAIFRT